LSWSSPIATSPEASVPLDYPKAMATAGANKSPLPPHLQLPLNRTETEGSNERDVTTRIPLVLCNDSEGENAVDNDHTDGPEDLSLSYLDGAAAAVLDAEVVEERDLEQEVQERMNNITVDATQVVNMSSNEEENARSDSRRKSTAVALVVASALIVLTIVSGTIIGTKTLQRKPLPAIVTASPSTSVSVWEAAKGILTPLSGEEALMDESSPQYKTLHWMVHDDPTNMMMMMVGNANQSSSPSTLMMILERYIMALLYFSTDGSNWVSSYDFLGNDSICEWGGTIRCNEERAAVGISMGKRHCVTILHSMLSHFHTHTHTHTHTHRETQNNTFLSCFLPILEKSPEQFKWHTAFRAVCALVT
jgi:hypothetical protein